MAYSEMPRRGYGYLALAADFNQIKSNLEAVHDRLVDPGTGVQTRIRSVSLSSGVSGTVTGGTTWIKEPLVANQYIEIMSSNYPAHKRFVVGFFGLISVYQNGATVTDAAFDLYMAKTWVAPSSSYKGTHHIYSPGSAGQQLLVPVSYVREIEADGAGNWLAFPILKIINCGSSVTVPQAGASGTLWYKEI